MLTLLIKKSVGNQPKQTVKTRLTERKMEPTEDKPIDSESAIATPTYAKKVAHGNSKANEPFYKSETVKIMEALDKLISRLDLQEKLYQMKFDRIENELANVKEK